MGSVTQVAPFLAVFYDASIMPAHLLKPLIAIPSPSGHEAALAAHLSEWARSRGFTPIGVEGNVVVRVPGSDPRRALVLNAHMDVVSPGDLSAWQHDPYAGHEEDGRVYGLGASDDKGGIATSMAVAEAYTSRKPPVDLWLTWVCREELDGAGSLAFARWFEAEWLARYAAVSAVLLESTESRFCEYEAKGNAFVKLLAQGEGGHAGLKDSRGPSPILQLAKAILAIEAQEARWRAEGLGDPTVLATSLRAGDPGSPNLLEPTAQAVVDVRTTAAMHHRVVGDLAAAVAETGVRVELMESCPGGHTDPDAEVIRALASIIPGFTAETTPTANDIFAFTGIRVPAVTFGPGTLSAIHRPNEYVEVANMALCVERLHALLEKLAA